MHRLLPLVFTVFCTSLVSADATLLVQEPYGRFGAIAPTGHAAVYLSRVCADTPVVLRRCRSGEMGVVISRYRKVSGYDWVAIPLIPYLYAVEDPGAVPEKADSTVVASLRNEYRRKHLQTVAPDGSGGQTPTGSWRELLGAAYNRKIYAFQIATTEAQDDALISLLTSRKNHSRFNLFFNNCADFSRRILNQYYPTAIRRNYVQDAGMTTPQQLARCLVSYAKHHEGFSLSVFSLQQIPGSRQPSQRVKGVAEGFVNSKKYMLPLTAFHPWIAVGVLALYLAQGRFNLDQYAETAYEPRDLVAMLESSALE